MTPPDGEESYRIASGYVRENFAPDDRLAVVMVNRRTKAVTQRLAEAKTIAAPDFQAWLRHKNAQRYEIYISMNALRPGARTREKPDVGAIRHVYLDFDDQGSAAVTRLLGRQDLPSPNYVLISSPDKLQTIWRVEGFEKEQAERLQRMLVREFGADPAATDCSRVLRLPGFYNHKYETPHLVTADSISTTVWKPEQFAAFLERHLETEQTGFVCGSRSAASPRTGALSQSERDWAFAKRALARGESPEFVIETIASYRRYEKHNPRYYAELTVRKAAAELGSNIRSQRNRG